MVDYTGNTEETEEVIKEYPKTTYQLEGRHALATGNLILTNRRLVFLRSTTPSDEELEKLQQLYQSKDLTTEKLIQFSLGLHKKNVQTPLSSIISAKLGIMFIFPSPVILPTMQPYLKVLYRSAGKKEKVLSYMFRPPFFKRLIMSEFPTLEWIWAINKAIKAQRKKTGYPSHLRQPKKAGYLEDGTTIG